MAVIQIGTDWSVLRLGSGKNSERFEQRVCSNLWVRLDTYKIDGIAY